MPDEAWRLEPVMTADLCPTHCPYASATTSISTDTSFGRRATSTVERAGGAFLQTFPYTSFICPNSDMFFRNTVVFTTFSQLLPAACRMADKFWSTRSVCASIPPSIKLPVAGSNATWPEINTKPFALMACEYGPIALGALGVETTSRVKPLMDPPKNKCSRRISEDQHAAFF